MLGRLEKLQVKLDAHPVQWVLGKGEAASRPFGRHVV
jgi:hypothetical protein